MRVDVKFRWKIWQFRRRVVVCVGILHMACSPLRSTVVGHRSLLAAEPFTAAATSTKPASTVLLSMILIL